MCGIIGYIGRNEAAPLLLNGITRLEYRGYDSVGMVTEGFKIKKGIGDVGSVHKEVNFLDLPGNFGVAHTRWATHGTVEHQNAHPHESSSKMVVAVHNGIIENYETLKKHLKAAGMTFASQTDSEVIPNYIEHKLRGGKSVPEAIQEFLKEAEGTFAIILMVKDDDKIYAIRRGSPLVLGVSDHGFYLGSDIYAFSDKTNKAVYFDDDEWLILEKENYNFYDDKGNELKKDINEFEWEQKESKKQNYEHYMIKEIMEEPEVAERLLLSLSSDQKKEFDKLVEMMKKARKTVFVGCGTSYHATLLGVYYLHKCGVEAQTLIASEFEHFAMLDKDSLVIAFSQSGETMDVIDALNYAKEQGAKIASVVNVPHSTIQRMADLSLNIHAGQEVCVASTKAFINQALVLLKLAREFGYEVPLGNIGDKIREVLELIPKIKKIAKEIHKKEDLYILGRGHGYPVAREMALKIKEVSYIHAEGMMGGELKHGTIALIEKGTPVISLICNDDVAMTSNSKEVELRGANVITIGSKSGDLVVGADDIGIFGILASTIGQLIAYYVAYYRGLPIDKPRNLAKSVTVR